MVDKNHESSTEVINHNALDETRYAIYFTLAQDNPLYQNASTWLAYDAYTGQEIDQQGQFKIENVDLSQYISNPQRYGFHATLKPPFRLHQDKSVDSLIESLEEFAKHIQTSTEPSSNGS